MKKALSAIFSLCLIAVSVCVLSFGASAASSTVRCTGENIKVATFENLKTALENFSDGNTVTLTQNITATNDASDLGIALKNKGAVTIDLNGYTLSVKSAKTKTLFEVTGECKLFFISDVIDRRGVILFNTKESDASLVRLKNPKAEVTNINIDLTMCKEYQNSNDGSDSYVFYAEKGARIDSYKGNISNHMITGNGIGAAENADNKSNFTMRIGGGTTVSAKKYCVIVNPDMAKYVRFGSCRFESLRDNTSEYVRIKTSDTAKISSFWSSSDDRSVVYVDGIVQLNTNKPIGTINKNIRANKQCDTLSPDSHYIVLKYAGGHVELCGTCYMSFDDVVAHTMQTTIGRPPSCTTDGFETGQICVDCAYSSGKVIPKIGHNLKYYPAKKVACGENGNIAHYKCENEKCGKYFADKNGEKELQYSEIFTVSTHNIIYEAPVAPTCTNPGLTEWSHCATCGEVITERKGIPALGHKETPIGVSVLPTCRYEGKTAGKMCSVCRAVLEEVKIIPKLDHATQIIKGKDATCTEDGLTDGEKCLECNVMIKEQEVIPAKGHSEEVLPAKRSTCKETGLTEGKKCKVCGVVTVPQELIEKGAHVPEIIKGKEATCIADGLTDGSKCFVCELVLEEQKVILKNDNHQIKTTMGKDATCEEEGLTEGKECTVCGKVIAEQTVITVKPHTEKLIKGSEATCENEGLSDGKECSVCGKTLQKQEVTPKLPHSEKLIPGKAATCDEEGLSNGIECSVCKKTLQKQEVIAKLNHSEKIIPGVAATCQNKGITDGIECSLCGKTLKKQETTAKIDHILSVSTNRATMEYDGEVVKTCAICKEEISKEVIYKIASVKYSVSSYDYDGKVKTPKIYVKNSEGELLKKNVDYKLDYPSGRKNIGKYTATVTFIGSYSGEKTLSFSIVPAKTSKISAKKATNTITLSWLKVNGATGYKVYIFDAKTKKYKTLKVTAKTSLKVEDLKSGTTYKFAVRTYTKTKNGNVWSKSYSVFTVTTSLKTPVAKISAEKTTATLLWNKIYNADGYAVYMKEGKDGEYKKIGNTKKLTFEKKKLKKGKTYFFKVRAYKKVGDTYVYSPFSTYKYIKIK